MSRGLHACWLLQLVAYHFSGSSAGRLPVDGDDFGLMPLLASPLFDPISGVAVHLSDSNNLLPRIEKHAQNDAARQTAFRFMKSHLNRLQPSLRHLLVLSSSPHEIDSYEWEAARSAMQSLLQEVHGTSTGLSAWSDDEDLLLPAQELSHNLQQALYHAEALPAPSFVFSLNGRPLLDRFLIREFIPHAQRIFTIKKGIESLSDQPIDEVAQEDVENLKDGWNVAHHRMHKSAITMLELLNKLRQSVDRSDNFHFLRRLYAIRSLLGFPSTDDDEANFMKRLDKAESQLLAIVHRKSPPVFDASNEKPVSFQKAAVILHQIEEMVPRLQALHDDLHATEESLRFVALRHQETEASHEATIEQNNALRSRLNRLWHDVATAHSALRSHMMAHITKRESGNMPKVDIMSPVVRFAQLENDTKKVAHPMRFDAEIEDLREKIRKLHRDAERFHHYHKMTAKIKDYDVTQDEA